MGKGGNGKGWYSQDWQQRPQPYYKPRNPGYNNYQPRPPASPFTQMVQGYQQVMGDFQALGEITKIGQAMTQGSNPFAQASSSSGGNENEAGLLKKLEDLVAKATPTGDNNGGGKASDLSAGSSGDGLTPEVFETMLSDSGLVSKMQSEISSVKQSVSSVTKAITSIQSTQTNGFNKMEQMLSALAAQQGNSGGNSGSRTGPESEAEEPPDLDAYDIIGSERLKLEISQEMHSNFCGIFLVGSQSKSLKNFFKDDPKAMPITSWWEMMYPCKKMKSWRDPLVSAGLAEDDFDEALTKETLLKLLLDNLGDSFELNAATKGKGLTKTGA